MRWNEPIPPDQGLLIEIGSASLWVRVGANEVWVHGVSGSDPLAGSVAFTPRDEPPGDTQRFVHAGEPVVIGVRCADRPVVVRPQMPLTLLPGSQTPIYVTTPVWLTLARATAEPFYELPVFHPNSTWFGATPQAGELAYASRSRARSRLELVEPRPGRILTRLTLVNALIAPWEVERIKVPTTHLPTFVTHDGTLWTPGITVRNSGEGEVGMDVAALPPDEAGSAERVGAARQHGTPRLTLGALGRLSPFGGFGG